MNTCRYLNEHIQKWVCRIAMRHMPHYKTAYSFCSAAYVHFAIRHMPHYKTACAQYKRHTHNKNGMRTIKTAYTQCKRHMLHLHWPKQNKNNMEDKCEMSGANKLHCDINYHHHRCHLPRCVVKEEGVSIDTIKQNSTYHPGVIICFHFYCSSVFTVNVESRDIIKK